MTQPRKMHLPSGQPDNKSRTRQESQPLDHEFLQLMDDLLEITELSAFVCQSLATLLADHDALDRNIRSGAQRYTDQLQARFRELRGQADQVLTRYLAENS